MNFVGSTYGLRPADAMTAYHGDKAIARFYDDYFNKHIVASFFAKGTDEEIAAKKRAALVDEQIKFSNDLASKCLGNGKFICGDSITVADCVVCGFFTNIVKNPRNKSAELWQEGYAQAPERVT